MSIDFGVRPWLALLVCLAVLGPLTFYYHSRLKAQGRRLRLALVCLRTAYTLGILLVLLDTTFTISRAEKRSLLLAVSDSPMMTLADTRAGKTRLDLAKDVLRSVGGDSRIRDHFRIEEHSFAGLARVVGQTPTASGSAGAVVLLADDSAQVVSEVESLGTRPGVPVFVVAFPAEESAPDISVNRIDSDGRAFLDSDEIVRAMVYGRGLKGRSTLIKLSDEALVAGSTTINWKADAETVIAELLFQPKAEGLRRYTLKAEPAEGEVNSGNNELSFSLDVTRAERKILYFENQPTWESKFLRRAMESNGLISVDYFAAISRSALLGQQQTVGAGGLRTILGDFWKLARYSAIIIGPTDASFLSRQQAQNISDFVERRGGGLILLGGNNYHGSILSASSPLASLSPAVVNLGRSSLGISATDQDTSSSEAQDSSPSGPLAFMVPTEEGKAHPLFRIRPEGEGAERVTGIERLGPLSGSYLRIASIKRGAVALAVDLGATQDSQAPVLIAAQNFGLGHTLLVAPADLWRLGLAETEQSKGALSVLWQNIAAWSSSGAEPQSYLRLESARIEEGDQVVAYLTLRDEMFEPVDDVSLRALVEFKIAGREPSVSLPAMIEPVAQGVCQIVAPGADKGEGVLTVSAASRSGDEHSLSLAFSVAESRSKWRHSPDGLERLGRLARSTGGELFEGGEVESLKSSLLKVNAETKPSTSRYKVRESLVTAFLLPLLMSAEFFFRRRYLIG